ncbi:E3 ubiquitin-protein ligase RNF31 isoform X2 [Gouania willdenowi]|uniref:E3 ubiquitin-protein ligase RNF31-like n=1 Tax=Gouania willdenowi TaxID=441366 RepID=A0A8C5DLC1_GOUWI|nr:E3 ubiquitin-protein ligase RNF31-like isoform X2 [Gouania willdenowi]
MPRVGVDAELQTLIECQYSHPQETLSDLQKVRALFVDLRLYVDFYCFPNKEKKRLVYLGGTVPVRYEGSVYNIPVCIWLHETHPVSRPRCYVCPSVSMMINPSCPCVDATGNISLDGLSNWTYGMSNLSAIMSEMKKNFQKHIPLYSNSTETLSAAGTQASHSGASTHRYTPSATPATSSPHLSGLKASQRQLIREVRRSYTEDLHGIDFSTPYCSSSSLSTNPFLNTTSSGDPSAESLDRMMGTLRLDAGSSRDWQAESPVQITQSTGNQCTTGPSAAFGRHPKLRADRSLSADVIQMASHLPSHQATIFLSLMTKKEHKFCPADVMEAVQLNRDYPSALRFLTHNCPICQEEVSFSKIITMTHCSCFLCQTCFTTFFSAAIKERSVEQLVCPQCSQPKIRGQKGMEESVEYFNLLDTQIRHFLPSEIHELFQRKLRDRALLEMPNFCWCAHCSFGILHEADRLRMDCPSCKKSTCSKCRTPWSPQHQGLSCEQFREWQQQQHQTDQQGTTALLNNSIECPNCHLIFSLSKGGCLHFTCTQCQHQFCGSCSSCFTLGSACSFSADCANKGLHAHHPRDCLYHLRDWSVSRLLLLLQCYRLSPSWMEDADSGSTDIELPAVCSVLELRDDGSREEEPCGRPTLPECKGYCQLHYKERLVELLKRCCADPAVLFTEAELVAELRRWHVSVPIREPDEPEPVYTGRLHTVLTNSVPLKGSCPLH